VCVLNYFQNKWFGSKEIVVITLFIGMVYIESVFRSDCKNVTFRNNYKNSQTSVDDKKKQLNYLINMFKIS